MARKKKEEDHENLERWLVSYADFITLLFAFFVVMYAISSVNEGKFRVLSESLVEAFNPSAYSSRKIEVGPKMTTAKMFTTPLETIAHLKEVLRDLEQGGEVRIFQDRRGIVIRIVDTVLFESGKAELRPEAFAPLDRIASVIGPLPNAIRVEGHTDNIPIRTPRFPSNWELSAARAISVVKRFIQEGIAPHRLEAVGYGEYRPIASNDTPEGRAKNRRVEIVIENRNLLLESGGAAFHPFKDLQVR